MLPVLSRKETRDAKAEGGLAPAANVGDDLLSGRSLLVQYFYRIAFVQHAFYNDRTINAGHPVVSLRYFL